MTNRRADLFFLTIMFLCAINAIAQPFKRQVEGIPVIVGGSPLTQPFQGGVNTPRNEFVDIDGDGDYDLFVMDNDLNLDFYRNEGTPVTPDFKLRPGLMQLPPFLTWLLFVDLNGDGRLDLLTDDSLTGVRYYQNEGTPQEPNFVLHASHMLDSSGSPILATSIGSPVFVDLNGDSLFDFLSSNIANGSLNYYQNVGTRSTPIFKFITDHLDNIIVLGDTCETGEARFSSYLHPTNILHGGAAVRFVDLFQKGTQDLYYGDLFSHGIFRMENIGTPTMPHLQCTTSRFPSDTLVTFGFNQPSFVDIDGDGDLDMFVGVLNDMERHGFWYFENIGTPSAPSFQLRTKDYISTLDIGENASPTLVDINGDGTLDLIMGTLYGELWYFRNDGTLGFPSFTLVDTLFGGISGNYTYAPAFVDIDGDGDKDVFVGQFNGRIKFYRNTGTPPNPQFTAAVSPTDTINVSLDASPAFADIDGDGDFDLFVGRADSGKMSFYRNVGDSTQFIPLLVTKNFEGISVGENARPTFCDVDGDGDYDLFIGNAEGMIAFYENVGTRTSPQFVFRSNHFALTDPMREAAPALGDIDGDGDPDLFVGTKKGGLHFYRNDLISGVSEHLHTPFTFKLQQNYPNPFNAETHFIFEMPNSPASYGGSQFGGLVSLKVFNIFGQEVANLVDSRLSPGIHHATWNAIDFPSGVYYYRLSSNHDTAMRNMLLLK
ncbi:MAG: T9SS type A sorting domain-containing protein [Ignavibacteria bacterium]|nr:T9SS type A sorting domain-containing protein [Ignavibacteria bacterium]